MNTKTLKDLFLTELADIYDAEKRMSKAHPKMVETATCPDLKHAIEHHQKETLGHVAKVEQVFQCFDLLPKGQTCEATKGLLEECDEIKAEFKNSPAINAALIAVAQKVEHYEMASYGCLHAWATLLGNTKAARILAGILAEEKAANDGLTKLAVTKCNKEALGVASAPAKPDASKGASDRKVPKATGKEPLVAAGVR